jgi:hypothetical protein
VSFQKNSQICGGEVADFERKVADFKKKWRIGVKLAGREFWGNHGGFSLNPPIL